MKKKIYFAISSVIQIIASFYIILNAQRIIIDQIDTIKETYSMFPADFQERILTMLQNNGIYFIMIMSSIAIILNAIILHNALNMDISTQKGKFIAFSVICFFTTESSIVSILSIINFIILLCLKNKKTEDNKKKKLEIPKIKYQEPTKKEKISSIIFIVIYASQFLISNLIPTDISKIAAMIITILIYVILFLTAILTFKDRLKRDFKLFKDNSKAYFRFIFPRIGIMYLVFILCNAMCIMISRKSHFYKSRNFRRDAKMVYSSNGNYMGTYSRRTHF